MHSKTNPRNLKFALDRVYEGVLQNLAPTLRQVEIADIAGKANDYLNGWAWLYITSGAAIGSIARIIDYVAATDVVVLDRDLRAVPGADTYAIFTVLCRESVIGVASAGGAMSLTCDPKEGIRPNFWAGCDVRLIGGTGGFKHSRDANRRRIASYSAGGVIVPEGPFSPAAGADTVYEILGHLSTPLKEVRFYDVDGKVLKVGFNLGELKNAGATMQEYDSGDEDSTPHWIEVAIDGAQDGTLFLHRSE